MKRARRRTVRSKVTRRVVIALLVTIFLISTVNLIYMSRRVMKEQRVELGLATELCASQIDSWDEEMKGITEGIANSLVAKKSMSEEDIRPLIDLVASQHQELFFVYVATEEGNMYMARGVQYAKNVDVRQRVWYKEVKTLGHTVVTNPYMSATRPDVMLATVATPIFIDNKFVGAVGVDASVSTINDFLNSIDFENGAYGFLLDSNKNVVVHQNEDFNPKGDTMASADDVMPELKAIIDNPGSNIEVEKDYRGEMMVYSTARLNESQWIIGVAYPQNNISKHVDRGIRISLFVALVCIIIASLDMAHIIKKVLRPIEKINPVMDRVLEGDFTTKVDFGASDDEIGELQFKVASILNTVSDIIEQQKYVLGEMEKGNLMVEDIDQMPGDLNEISQSVNSIKETFNNIISDIQFSAINLQSFAMGINESSDIAEMRMVFEELSAEANALMDKTAKFKTAIRTPEDKMLEETMSKDE